MLSRRHSVLAALLILLCTGLVSLGCRQTADAARDIEPVASSFGTYTNGEAAIYDGWQRSSVYIPMKDGTRIAIDTYLPTRAGTVVDQPVPVVLHYTRYIRAMEVEGELRTQVDGDPMLQHMLKHGYAVAVADARGTGASFGVHNGAFSIEENADSYDIIEWLGEQPWSNGRVGMAGRSYPGMTQYQAAVQAPPALKAIFAEMAGPTPFDFVYRGGTYKKDFIEQWGTATRSMDEGTMAPPARVDADQDGSLRDAAVAEHAANIWAQELVGLDAARLRDGGNTFPSGASWSWDSVGTIDDIDKIEASGVAIYHLVGWYDIYTSQQPLLFASLEKTPQKMMIGPWVHSGGYGGTVHKAEMLRWYDYWLKGIDNGVMDEAPVHYFVMKGNNTLPGSEGVTVSTDEAAAEDGSLWRSAETWPPAGLVATPYYLSQDESGSVASVNDGSLTLSSDDTTTQNSYTVDYSAATGSFSRWMNGYGSRRQQPEGSTFFDPRTQEDAKLLTYTSAPLEQDLEILGYPIVHLWVDSNRDDGDFFVYLEEIDDQGQAHYVAEGALRASYRAIGAGVWNELGIPHHPSHESDLAPLPGEPVELVFDLTGTSIVIDQGHRLRISIAGADAANYELYPDPTGKDAPTIQVYLGGDKASFIQVPTLAG